MNKLIAALKKIRLRQAFMVFMAGMLLLVSTACNRVQAGTPDNVVTGTRQEVPAGKLAVPGKENPRPEVPEKATTSKFEGGPTMNEFSDVDPRAKDLEKATSSKAQALKENAERNVIDQTSNLGENTKRILDKKGENAADFGKNVQRNAEDAAEKAQGTTENLVKGTKRGTENIKDNTLDATKDVNRSASRAADNVKDTTKDLSKSVKRSADDTSDYVQDKADRATGRSFFDKVGDAIKDTVD